MVNRSLVRGGKPYAPVDPADVEILPGVADALARLRDAGFVNVVVTNQPDIATGAQSRERLDEIHRRLSASLAIDDIRVCPHVDADACGCRKPAPGLLLDAARELGIDVSASLLVGDRWRDIEAGQRAGCRCYFIDYNYAETRPAPPYTRVDSLAEAADLILAR